MISMVNVKNSYVILILSYDIKRKETCDNQLPGYIIIQEKMKNV